LPAKLSRGFGRINRVAIVVARPVGDELDLFGMASTIRSRSASVHNRANRLCEFYIADLIVSADIKAVTGLTVLKYGKNSADMVIYVKPIADIFAMAINQCRLARQSLVDDCWNELLAILERAVIVGAIGNDGWKTVVDVPRACQMTGGCLAGRIGRVGPIGGGFRKKTVVAKAAVNFVRRNVNEPEACALFFFKIAPIGERALQHHEGAMDVCFDKFCRAIDRAIDMRLCGEMKNRFGRKFSERASDPVPVEDIHFREAVVGRTSDRCDRTKIASIRQGNFH
jgi:hypothetical protein